MKKLHDVLFDEYKRMYVDEEPHTLLTGDEEADKSAFFEKGKLGRSSLRLGIMTPYAV